MKSLIVLALLLGIGAPAFAAQPMPAKKGAAPVVKKAAVVPRAPVRKPATSSAVQASTTSATTAQVKNVWLSPAEGFPLAKKLNKPVMVDFYTDWCGWCHVLEEKTFKDPTVSKLLKDNFVLVKANAEDSGDGTKLASMLRVNGFPTTWFFQPSGDPIGYISGFKPPEVFKLVIGELLAGKFTARANAQVMPAGTEVTTPATLVSPPAPPAPPRAP